MVSFQRCYEGLNMYILSHSLHLGNSLDPVDDANEQDVAMDEGEDGNGVCLPLYVVTLGLTIHRLIWKMVKR